jgi:gliding motility-associated-like protein
MKSRFILIIAVLLVNSGALAQPPETIYPGTVAKSGYADQASYGPFNVGFNFTFFGNIYTQFYVTSNGLILFGAESIDGSEDPIPTAGTPNNFIAPFWDDLTINAAGNILYTTIGAAPNRKLIIQFRNMGFYPNPVYMGTFAAILYETTNIIQVQYRLIVLKLDRAFGGSATIGLENSDGSSGVQYAYHSPTAVSTSKAISFTPSGSTHNIDSNAIYDGVYLTTNVTLPEPGIATLLSPANDAIIGTSQRFEWATSEYASSYSLKISSYADLSSATSYDAGANLFYDVTGLQVNTTYYWTVFTLNATGLTWSEVKQFTTSAAPPLAAVPQTLWVEKGLEKTIPLNYTGGDASSKTAIITSLPAQGLLYQYNAGIKGNLITSVPATVTDPGRHVIYLASGNSGNGAGNFNFKIHDDTGDSPEALITVNVNPPGVPNLLFTARNANVEIQFDIPMANPSGKQSQFTVKVNGTPAVITFANLKPGDPNTIILALQTPLTGPETVLVSYTQGDVTAATGGLLSSFTDLPVTLLAQTITFDEIPFKQLSDSPFTLTAISSSGLGFTYSSSNQTVATIAGNTVTLHAMGTSDITARQAGNATYAPAKYIRTLYVGKETQTITFNPLPSKTYGDSDFSPGATASSGLPVDYSSNDQSVARIVDGKIHIVSGGSAIITASQPGDATYFPAPDVQRTLTVNKVDLTFTADNKTRSYNEPNPGLTYQITGFLSGEDQSVLDVLPTIQTTAIQSSPVDDYPITFTGGSDNNYNYVFVSGTLTVTKINQTITFVDVPEKLRVNDSYTLVATSTSGLTVLFASMNTQIATVTGDQLTGVSKGSVQIKAYHPGDQNYNPAETFATVEVFSAHKDIMHLFTPNNDGFNDLWELPDLDNYGKCEVKIYNRWGKLVYSSPNYNNTWDGTSNGKDLPEAAYYFVIKTQNSGTIKGTVNIVR